ncbi:MAG: hypothetical protein A3F12_04375 [Gammaproteobacteria bacterium RIFCSPHIGHO2_12_FULL_38_14]|nr:MAG: hypothetical protein A3F12_04375 [Gammaproteobacteria bacterium RIFCSPHIGHO2_12_FULL_38_14]
MKLKLVVASMSLLGLISSPAFAATNHVKHKKHHQKAMAQQTTTHHDYKDMGSMPIQPAEACTLSPASLTMIQMTQNTARAIPNPCNPGWYNRLQISGGMNIDVGKWGSRNTNYMGENYQRLSINDAYLNFAAKVNDWAKAFASLSYSNPTTVANPGLFGPYGAAEYSSAYSNNINAGAASNVQLEQAFVTLGNFDQSPLFVQLGKQYQDFGRYEIHPITRSVTQVMSETLATSAKVGFIMNGFNGSIYAFDTPINKLGTSSSPTDYGAALGYTQTTDQLSWDVGAGYLYNLIGVNDVAFSVANATGNLGGLGAGTVGYNTRVGAYALYADVNTGPFSVGARLVSALQRFNPNDLAQNGIVDTGGSITGANTNSNGAKPLAGSIQAGYGFNAWDMNQNVYVGYQGTRQAAALNLPRTRGLAGYGIDVWTNTNLAVEWDHDWAYSTSHGGTGDGSNLVSLRASVMFS